jgi:hypothetical protein
MTTALMDAAQPFRELPEDLRQVVGERRLIELALEAAQVVSEGLPHPERIAGGQPGPGMLLTLLTYCYAAGIYASEDVEWACESDSGARYICANVCPDQETIRRFRRANRPWVEACIVWVCSKAFHEAKTNADFTAVVRQRIELAIMMDTATCD